MAADKPETKERAGRGGRKALLLPAALVLVAGLACVALMAWPRSAGPSTAERSAVTPSGLVAVEPFLVNLADRQPQRFARVTVRLIVETAEEAEAISSDPLRQARLRSAILELLAQQTADGLSTPDGKDQLKSAIAERGTRVLEQRVHDVLFTDFVVQ